MREIDWLEIEVGEFDDPFDLGLRELKRGGSSGGSSFGSSKGRSTGNCYGERCDNIGGSSETAIIVGAVIGGCCLVLLCYVMIKWI